MSEVPEVMISQTRVCLVSHDAGRAGAERCLIEIADALRRRQANCFVLLPGKGPLENELRRIGVSYAIIPYRWWVDTKTGWRRFPKHVKTAVALPKIVQKLRSWNVDIVMTNTITVVAGALAAFICRKPHVWHVHEFGREDHSLKYDAGIRVAGALIDGLSEAVIVNSKAVEGYYSAYISAAKTRTVYPAPHPRAGPVPTTRVFMGAAPKLALVGTISQGKAQMDALIALTRLASRGVRVELAVVGDGDTEYADRLRRVALDSGLSEYVHFLGWVDDPRGVVGAADIVLVCSRAEAFGLVTVEAMMLGKPVIGANSGATPELVQQGLNGLLYRPGDATDLAEKIKYLIGHQDIARQMGENGRKLAAERFTVERYTSGVIQVLSEVLAKRVAS